MMKLMKIQMFLKVIEYILYYHELLVYINHIRPSHLVIGPGLYLGLIYQD